MEPSTNHPKTNFTTGQLTFAGSAIFNYFLPTALSILTFGQTSRGGSSVTAVAVPRAVSGGSCMQGCAAAGGR